MTQEYLLDQMFNGLVEELRQDGIECKTATQSILHSSDSRIGIPDDKIIEFLKGDGRELTLITADMRLAKKCEQLGIHCMAINQKEIVLEHIRKIRAQ